jgi:hypothetical protein
VNVSSGKGAPRVLRHLGAQLPLFIRGVYYEGSRPTKTPAYERQPAEFVSIVASQFRQTLEARR